MADRIPLIVNSTASQIQEVPDGDVVSLPNNALKFGAGLNISYTDAVPHGSKITHSGTDDLRLQIAANQIIFEKTSGENFISCTHSDGKVNISYNGSKKFSTSGVGVTVYGALDATGDITAFATSDENWKDSLSPITNAITKVGLMTGYTFTWNDKAGTPQWSHLVGKEDTGLIAQDVAKLGLPGITTTREDGAMAIRYDRLAAILTEAVKELKKENDDLKTLIKNSSSFANLKSSL